MPQTYRLKYLTGIRLQTFLAVANQILPADEHSPSGGTMQTAAVVDWALERVPVPLRKKILLFFLVIEIFGFFFGGRGFSKNSSSKQEWQLKWLESNKIRLFRMGFFGIKTYVEMGYYTREDIWKAINYDGPIFPDKQYADNTIRQLCRNELQIAEA